MDKKEILEKIKKELDKVLINNPTFTGNVKINFYLGGVANITVTESFKIK